ncbi:dymeclin isoform X2 [Cynara cardunculus var. scolymus]|uniref:dymeclin isoform X2 n=1 Tax=Cynara cardunculus var. scolymus TaxID=59895 RepID=UPI000D625779|nr:dymeclin isoform X2 [Cynara cardunculus var. scolymus]
MGAVPSTPRWGGELSQDTAEYLIGTFVGDKTFPLNSDYWQKLLELPFDLHWPAHRVEQACQAFARNNCSTRHLAKLLIHLTWCLQASLSTPDVQSVASIKAVNASYIASVFLKYSIEDLKSENLEDLNLSLDENEAIQHDIGKDESIINMVMHAILCYIGRVDISPKTYLLHHELLNFMLIAMSTQLLSGPSPGPNDVHPFIDAAMSEESSLVGLVVRKLLLNFITRPRTSSSASYTLLSEENRLGVLKRVGSAAGGTSLRRGVIQTVCLLFSANIVLLPLSYFVNSSVEASRSQLADSSINILLILIHYRKCILVESVKNSIAGVTSESLLKEETYFAENRYCKALENVRDVEFDRVDIEGNAHTGPLVRLSFASLFDTLGMCLGDETAVLLLYALVHGNSDFLEYVLVRTDIDTLLMPLLETLYDASRRTSNQIYMVLIILLILSQDSSFNASIHKLILPSVPWYQERLLHQTSLGSLMVIILIRTVKYNMSKMRDVYLHTNCLATLANMAPHVHRLSSYASQRLVSLFDMLSRKYAKLAELKNDKMQMSDSELKDDDKLPEDTSAELHIYTDFLRIVLEILNAILTYALPRNPEVIYAIMHRQEVFQPFRNHPRFNELLENIFSVLDFFNSRMDAQKLDGEWSVEKVLQVININCRFWRGDGMKMFTQLRFTYEQESHPEEFFIPYVWQLVISRSGFSFNPSSINLFPVELPVEVSFAAAEANTDQNIQLNVKEAVELSV